MRQPFLILLAGLPLLAMPPALSAQDLAGDAPAPSAAVQPAGDAGFTPELFRRWIDVRVGVGDPVYWYSIGTVRSFPDGKLLYRMEGYDTARMHWPDAELLLAHQYNRKIYVFRDPATNAVITQKDGRPVAPIAYPYQFITYMLKNADVETVVEQGAGKQLRRIGPGEGMSVKALGETLVFSAPVYLDFEIPGAPVRYEAFENYDFLIQPEKSGLAVPNQLSWVRYGPLPPALGGGRSIMHLVSWRVDTYAALPETIRSYVEAEAPLWMSPPQDLEEVRILQQDGAEGAGFSGK